MVLPQPIPSNWSRTFNVWIQDIQVQFRPRVVCRGLKRGLLGRVRPTVRWSASLVAMLFSLHCTRPGTLLLPRVESARDVYARLETSLEIPEERGHASWYGSEEDGFAWLPTASGEPCDPEALTCAHRTLPFGSLVEVENLDNGRRVVLRVNDRGPYQSGRILDTTSRGARMLGFRAAGTARVAVRTVEALGRAPLLGRMVPDLEAPAVAETLARLDLDEVRSASEYRTPLPDEGWGWLRLRAGAPERGMTPGDPVETPRRKDSAHVRQPYLHRED